MSDQFEHKRRFENPLAYLVAHSKITQQQYLAGQKYAEVYTKYLESIGAPHLGGAASDVSLPSDRQCRIRKEAYQEAYHKLEAVGARARMSVTNIAVYEQPPVDEWDLESLRIGLSALL